MNRGSAAARWGALHLGRSGTTLPRLGAAPVFLWQSLVSPRKRGPIKTLLVSPASSQPRLLKAGGGAPHGDPMVGQAKRRAGRQLAATTGCQSWIGQPRRRKRPVGPELAEPGWGDVERGVPPSCWSVAAGATAGAFGAGQRCRQDWRWVRDLRVGAEAVQYAAPGAAALARHQIRIWCAGPGTGASPGGEAIVGV